MHLRDRMRDDAGRFWRGAAAGAVATLVMSIVMIAGYAFGPRILVPFSLLTTLVARVIGNTGPAAFAIAIPLHFAYGALWAACAAVESDRMTWRRGVVVGLGIWLIMAIFLLPLAGADVFTLATKATVWIFSLALHVIYGATFGAILEQQRTARAHR